MKLWNQGGGWIILQDIKKPDHDDWGERAECSGVSNALGKERESITTGTSQTGYLHSPES